MVPDRAGMLLGMEFCERLDQAMKRAGVSEHQLAKHLGISYQGVKKALSGGRNGKSEMTASNNSKAARFLRVDPDWLATGAGNMDEKVWPFERVTREQIDALAPNDRAAVEGAMMFAMAQVGAASNVTSKPETKQTAGKELRGGLMNLSGLPKQAPSTRRKHGG